MGRCSQGRGASASHGRLRGDGPPADAHAGQGDLSPPRHHADPRSRAAAWPRAARRPGVYRRPGGHRGVARLPGMVRTEHAGRGRLLRPVIVPAVVAGGGLSGAGPAATRLPATRARLPRVRRGRRARVFEGRHHSASRPDIPRHRRPEASTQGIARRRFSTIVAALALTLALASPALAATGAGGAGAACGQHRAAMAQEMGGFSGDHNPGVVYRGFSGWKGM